MTNQNKYTSLEEYLAGPPRPPRANKKWSSPEVTKLLFLHGEGRSPDEIAEALGRTEMAIRVKLSKLAGLRHAFQ